MTPAGLTGPGELVALRMDLVGLRSFEGRRALISLGFASVNEGALMKFGHGEKFTRLDWRLEGAPVESFCRK